ncbi:MAG TPA: N-6 DNA methylase [Phycisphaerae bacterium]|nr:N-6 DNA methylase [Phycisphaerae bacterium]
MTLFSGADDARALIETAYSGDAPPSAIAGGAHRRQPYEGLYRALSALREEFHRIGRFDDANAKLDEICKLLVLKVLDARHPPANGRSRLDRAHLDAVAKEHTGDPGRIAFALREVFQDLARQFPDEISSFGPESGLNIREDDDDFAVAILPLLRELPGEGAEHANRWEFDSLNEVFGHFIQDSFRNRKEDAQYMTPPEVVAAVVDMAIQDLLPQLHGASENRKVLVADPTCGVGSFLAAFYRHACHVDVDGASLARRVTLFGQDKVERMIRLAAVNLKIFAKAKCTLRQGNSILPASSLADIAGKVDLVLTNPPFGATFDTQRVLGEADPQTYPVLFSMGQTRTLPKALDSEYLLLDRELALLRPGGCLFMVVPDHVVSAGGFSEQFRHALSRRAELVGVLDLPTETFAQAGTRTKTSVVYLQRKDPSPVRAVRHVFMAVSEDLGFRVVARNGASVKRVVGAGDLNDIVAAFRAFRARSNVKEDVALLREHPSVTAVDRERALNSRWTAGFYQTQRLAALKRLAGLDRSSFESKRLVDIVDVDPEGGERVLPDEENRCISVLHVGEDGCIDMRAVNNYRPTTACVRCREGDVLVSKINPRIVRIAVVPSTRWKLGCSAEFAVLRARQTGLSPWALCLILRSSAVQAQIQTLTTGTSSSHNRLKTRDLEVIRVPLPKKEADARRQLDQAADRYRQAVLQRYRALDALGTCFDAVEDLLSG